MGRSRALTDVTLIGETVTHDAGKRGLRRFFVMAKMTTQKKNSDSVLFRKVDGLCDIYSGLDEYLYVSDEKENHLPVPSVRKRLLRRPIFLF